MLHAGTNIQLHDKINSRGNKEQHATIRGTKTIWGGGSPSARRKGVVVSNEHLRLKNHTSITYFEFY